MKKVLIWSLLSCFMLLGGCVTPPKYTSKQEAFPELYKEHPLSVLVVPAVNRSTAADAPELYSTTIAQPLAEAGYYVMPLPLTNLVLQGEGVTDGAQLANIDARKFNQLMGADAVLFVTINQWDTNYYVTGGNVTVGAAFRLVSTTTGEDLWNYNNVVVYDTSGGSNAGGLLGAIIATALSTAMTDYVPVARMVNGTVIKTLPVGRYNARFGKDGADKFVEKPPAKSGS
ncbi:GNA1162 family protein [Gallaecimonas mangrovi]|uniref:GNA1162 family protein n=1 Tax=Gallaecimonas mangrovi TaxID=2291597 RepID=UPI000E2060D4|nr:GNA1162 family protein [Gallaecimonas mangrovi]